MSAPRRPGPPRRVQGERPALGPRREDGGGRRPPEARDDRDRQRATSWQTPRPSPTGWPTAASGATPTCGPTRAVWAQSGTTTGTGGSGRSLLASANRRPARQPPRGRDTREPDHAGLPRIPGGRRPRGNLARVVSSDMSARPPRRRDSTCRTSRATSCPCPRPGTAPGRTWPGASSRGRSAGRFAASGSRAGTSPGEDPAPPREASAEPFVHGWGRDLSGTGPTTEGPVVDTLLPGWGRRGTLVAGRYARRLHHRHQPRTGERQGRPLRKGAQDVEPGPHHPVRGAHPPGVQGHARRAPPADGQVRPRGRPLRPGPRSSRAAPPRPSCPGKELRPSARRTALPARSAACAAPSRP